MKCWEGLKTLSGGTLDDGNRIKCFELIRVQFYNSNQIKLAGLGYPIVFPEIIVNKNKKEGNISVPLLLSY